MYTRFTIKYKYSLKTNKLQVLLPVLLFFFLHTKGITRILKQSGNLANKLRKTQDSTLVPIHRNTNRVKSTYAGCSGDYKNRVFL